MVFVKVIFKAVTSFASLTPRTRNLGFLDPIPRIDAAPHKIELEKRVSLGVVMLA